VAVTNSFPPTSVSEVVTKSDTIVFSTQRFNPIDTLEMQSGANA
jgi:hypothetical protein